MRASAAPVLLVLIISSFTAAQTRDAPAAAVRSTATIIETPDNATRTEWDKRVAHMIRRGELKLREEQISPDGVRRDQWFVQLYKGVPVIGAEVWRQLEAKKAVALEGSVYNGIALNPVPRLTRQEAQDALTTLAGGGPGPSLPPILGILPRPDGTYVLVYQARLYSDAGLTLYSLDASTGAVVQQEAEPGAPK